MTMETVITQVEAEWPSQDYIPTEKLLNHILGCGSGETSPQHGVKIQ